MELKQGLRDIEFLSDPTAGELKIGCTEAIAATLTPILEPFFRKYPRVVVHMDPSDNLGPQLPALRARRCDLIVRHLATPILDDLPIGDLDVEILFNDRLVVAVGMRSPWARRRKIDLADLVDEPWILVAPDSWNYRIITEAFRARGLNIPRIRLVTFSVHLRADMIASRRMHHHVSGFRGALFCCTFSGEGATGRFAGATMADGNCDAEKIER